jgi:hypothetical protein
VDKKQVAAHNESQSLIVSRFSITTEERTMEESEESTQSLSRGLSASTTAKNKDT